MQITFSLLTLIALMPLSLHAWNSIGTRPILDSTRYRKIPYGTNPFSVAKTKIIERWRSNYGYRSNALQVKFNNFYSAVQKQWDYWIKDFYAATSENEEYVMGKGLNAWRAQVEEHLLGIARSLGAELTEYNVLMVQELLVGFKEYVLLDLVVLARSGNFVGTNIIPLFNPSNQYFCWPKKKYGTSIQVTVHDTCGPTKWCYQGLGTGVTVIGTGVKIGGICVSCTTTPCSKPIADYYTVLPNPSNYSYANYQKTENPIYKG